mmetsp:Transcript_22891/g.68713  ORF Transcript_22891/g.68713 Transcript_22891/m.68713 type:complete len:118 (+) Transcript_22891:611-964(+)
MRRVVGRALSPDVGGLGPPDEAHRSASEYPYLDVRYRPGERQRHERLLEHRAERAASAVRVDHAAPLGRGRFEAEPRAYAAVLVAEAVERELLPRKGRQFERRDGALAHLAETRRLW